MKYFFPFIAAVLASACSPKQLPLKEPEISVEPAPEWTNLFYRQSGWFGADGIFSIPLSGVDKPGNAGNSETLLLFSDTYIGDVENGKPRPGNRMVNNTVAIVKGNTAHPDSIEFYYKKAADGSPATFFVPEHMPGKKDHFWLGDGFVNQEKDNTLYIFAYNIEVTGSGVFDFREPGVSVIAIPRESQRPPFDGYRQIPTPFHINTEVVGEGNFGAGVLVNTRQAGSPAPDGFVYVYACTGKDKNLLAARVKPRDFEKFDQWSFWTGDKWVAEMNEARPICNAVSNELSVTPLPDGRFALVFQVMGLSDKVGMRIGNSPVGPFGPIREIWRTPEMDEGLFCYNAKAHPNLSKPGELLVSYNTITLDFWNDIQKNAHIYRPRFVKIKF